MQSQKSNLERITALEELMARYFKDIPLFQTVGAQQTFIFVNESVDC